jgi:hypothetical protein
MAGLSPKVFTLFVRHRIALTCGALIALGAVGLAGGCSDTTTSYTIDAGGTSGMASGSTSGQGSGSTSGGFASGASTSGGSTSGTITTSGGSTGSGASGSSGAASGAGGSGNGGTVDGGTAEGGDDGSADGADATGCPFDPNKTSPGVCGCGIPDNASGDVTGDGGIDCLPGHYYEAEDGTLSSTNAAVVWTVFGNDPNAAGGKYILSPSEVDDTQAGPAQASYTLHIPADGMYVIWGRFYAPNVNSDRVWMRVDANPYQRLRGTTGDTWHWFHFHKDGDWDNPILFQLTKGDHTLDMANDAPGLKIDRFYVTSGGDVPKPGAGDDLTCNPPHTIFKAGACASSCGTLSGNSCDPVACQGQTHLPAYDCTVCCQLPAADAGGDDATDAGGDAATDAGTE